jgi:hypothetical protein
MTISAPITTSPVTISAPVTLGYVGPAGPNSVTTATTTNLTGVLVGDGANVGVKTPGETRAYLDLEDADILAAWEDETGVTVAGLQAADLRHSLIGYATSTRMNSNAVLTGYSASAVTNLHIGTAATSIGNSAFYQCGDIPHIHIPGNITAIGNSAFTQGGPSLDSIETITFEEGLLSIGSYAFYYVSNANFTTLVLPDSLLTIDDHAFNSWGYSFLASVTLGSGLTSIGEYSFANLLITSITLPESLETIGYHSFDSCSLAGDLVIPDSVTSIGDYAFAYCSSLDDVYTSIPFADFPALALSSCGAGNLYVHADQVGDYGGTHGSKTVLTWDNYPDPTPN